MSTLYKKMYSPALQSISVDDHPCLGVEGRTQLVPRKAEAPVQAARAEAADCAAALHRTAPRHSSGDEEKDDDTHRALAFPGDTHSCEGSYEGNISATVLTRAAARGKTQPSHPTRSSQAVFIPGTLKNDLWLNNCWFGVYGFM